MTANGDTAGAIALLESEVAEVDPVRLAWIHATLLVELAHLRDLAGDVAGARLEAAAAAAAFERLDVVVAAETTQLLDRLTGRSDGVRSSSGHRNAGARWQVVERRPRRRPCSHPGLEGPRLSRRV